jgi:hypothetical protein
VERWRFIQNAVNFNMPEQVGRLASWPIIYSGKFLVAAQESHPVMVPWYLKLAAYIRFVRRRSYHDQYSPSKL